MNMWLGKNVFFTVTTWNFPAISTKAMNDTMNQKGLVPSLQVCGISRRFSAISSRLPDQNERIEARSCANREIEASVA